MVNYKKMYHQLADATEKMLEILIEAQQKCEDIYIDTAENEDDTE